MESVKESRKNYGGSRGDVDHVSRLTRGISPEEATTHINMTLFLCFAKKCAK
jgi:hypothetical protein